MKPASTIADNGAFSVHKSIFGPEGITIRFKPRKSIFEFALRARKITIIGDLEILKKNRVYWQTPAALLASSRRLIVVRFVRLSATSY